MVRSYFTIMLRNLRKHKAYALINISGLAVGMACCVLILLYVRDELGYDRYHARSDRIYRVVNGTNANTPPALAPALQDDFPEVVGYARFKPPFGIWMMRYGDNVFYEKQVYWAEESIFDIFSWSLAQGDPGTALKEPYSVVISEEMARKYFPDEDPMGKIISADDDFMYVKVTGVMKNIPKNSHFTADFFFSFSTLPKQYNPNIVTNWDGGGFYTYLLLSPDAPPDELESKLPGVIEKYRKRQENADGMVLEPSLQALTDIHLHSHLENELGANSDMTYIYILSSIALFILLIACINFMNLATARSATRAREVGLRKVLGAYRFQLIRQFLIESILVSLVALLLAVVLIHLVLPGFNAFTGKELALALYESDLLLSLIGIALFVGIVAGSYPAFFLSAFQPEDVLKESVKAGGSGAMLRKTLVVVQFAIATVFIIGTGTVYEQLEYIQDRRLGFDKEHVITVPAAISPIFQRLESFENALLVNASVLGVSISSSLPGRSGGTGILQSVPVRPAGFTEEEPLEIPILSGDPDLLTTLGLELAAGRGFWRDNATADSSSFLLNETAVRRFGWASPETAIGRQAEAGGRRWTVIGVLKDFHMRSLHSSIEPLVLLPGGGNHISIRISPGHITATLDFIEDTWKSVYPNYPFIYSFLDEDFARLYRDETRLSYLFGVFSLMTVFIACLGLLGLASFTAEQRTKEIGVRKTLGASVSNIVLMLSREVVVLILLSNVIAWPVAFLVMNNWLKDFAYRIEMGIGVFVFGGVLALAIAVLTVSYQAIKAATINPVKALRYE